MNLDGKSKVTVPLSLLWTLATIISSGTAFLVGAYAESAAIPKRLDAVELQIATLAKDAEERKSNDMVNCLILQRIQNVVVPPNYRIEKKCEK
jgi:hypothetical protein